MAIHLFSRLPRNDKGADGEPTTIRAVRPERVSLSKLRLGVYLTRTLSGSSDPASLGPCLLVGMLL